MVSLLSSVVLSVVVGMATGLAQGEGCRPAGPSELLGSASLPATSAVVEYTYLASSPLPWGRSALVATRVWGSTLVERWVVSDARSSSCPDLAVGDAGSVVYLFVGSGAVEVASPEPVSGAEAGALVVRFGEPGRYEVTGVDRVMAWVRVAFDLLAAVTSVVALGAVIIVRRRRRRRDRYLF